jgi:SAM-dependent methyltransferase
MAPHRRHFSSVQSNELPGRCFAEPLGDLGDDDAALRGILVPESQRGARPRGVTAQFLEHAAEYHRRYANVEHFRMLVGDALAKLDPPIAPQLILDIGSGSGNSVIPLLDRFDDAFVVATDISPQLLAILRDYLAANPRYAGRYALVCVDAGRARYRADAFDLAVGAALLHHVIDPAGVIDACEQALAPGGAAVFFEPFELGHAVLNLAYRDILAEAERRDDRAKGFDMVRRLHDDYVRRADASDPRLLDLDDKWMFTPAFFEEAARRGRWAQCVIYPVHDSASPLRDETIVNLRLGMDLPESALPTWAWERIDEYQRAFSAPARAQLMFEGAVVLRTRVAPSGVRSGWWYDAAAPGRGFFLELRDDQVSVVACHYDARGEPVWHVAGPARVRDGVTIVRPRGTNTACSADDDSPNGSASPTVSSPAGMPAPQGDWRMRFVSDARIDLDWPGERIALARQHADSTGWSATRRGGVSGLWSEAGPHSSVTVAIEDLDTRVFAALLMRDGWYVATAMRGPTGSFHGAWLRFCGGQAPGAPYRAPGAPSAAGDAHFDEMDGERLVMRLPDGSYRVLQRGVRPRASR